MCCARPPVAVPLAASQTDRKALVRGSAERLVPVMAAVGVRALLPGWQDAGAGFIIREHGRHPRLAAQGDWQECGRTQTGAVREQAITLEDQTGAAPWRRI